jgi:hypothetical protein
MRRNLFSLIVFSFLVSLKAYSIGLDWSGQFWFDNHWLNNYQLDRSRPSYDNDTDFINRGGAYVPGVGSRNVVWYSAFLKLKPKVIVNDSVNIKSEFHVGTPSGGFFGQGYPSAYDARYDITGSQKNSANITAQRVWANLITDFGTLELGRAPIHWGLGAVWNSGDKLFDRFQSTGDTIRLNSKFGNFWLIPSLTKVAMGRNLGGAMDPTGLNTVQGDDDVTDVSVAAKYDNTEEDFEFGFKWNRRAGNSAQNSIVFNSSGLGSKRIAFNIYDFYAKKKIGRYTLSGEVPVISGSIGAIDGAREYDYKSFALIAESTYTSDRWLITLRAGHVPGQPSSEPVAGQPAGAAVTAATDSTYKPIYLNRNYKLGLIMFNYNIYGLGNNNPDLVGDDTRNNPFDAGIVNANYVSLAPHLKLDKWTLKWNVILGYADKTAQSGKNFYNYQQRKMYNAIQNQGNFLGKEFDFGLDFQWDENVIASWDMGMWFPGSYYQFMNHPMYNNPELSMMWASFVKVGIQF